MVASTCVPRDLAMVKDAAMKIVLRTAANRPLAVSGMVEFVEE